TPDGFATSAGYLYRNHSHLQTTAASRREGAGTGGMGIRAGTGAGTGAGGPFVAGSNLTRFASTGLKQKLPHARAEQEDVATGYTSGSHYAPYISVPYQHKPVPASSLRDDSAGSRSRGKEKASVQKTHLGSPDKSKAQARMRALVAARLERVGELGGGGVVGGGVGGDGEGGIMLRAQSPPKPPTQSQSQSQSPFLAQAQACSPPRPPLNPSPPTAATHSTTAPTPPTATLTAPTVHRVPEPSPVSVPLSMGSRGSMGTGVGMGSGYFQQGQAQAHYIQAQAREMQGQGQ
ncbi:hypothetical protein B484DRAFT_410996, partial [Ochromonadaceae sp. CCMP2298]